MIRTLKQYFSLRGLLAKRLKRIKNRDSASNYASYLFEQDNLLLKNMYLEFLVKDLCKDLSQYINDNPESIRQRVSKEYGLYYKFTPEQLEQIKLHG